MPDDNLLVEHWSKWKMTPWLNIGCVAQEYRVSNFDVIPYKFDFWVKKSCMLLQSYDFLYMARLMKVEFSYARVGQIHLWRHRGRPNLIKAVSIEIWNQLTNMSDVMLFILQQPKTILKRIFTYCIQIAILTRHMFSLLVKADWTYGWLLYSSFLISLSIPSHM